MNNRTNPKDAYLMASINAAYACGRNLKNCEKYSNMTKELEPIAIQYKKNEEELKKTNVLVVESYKDWCNFQDHTMESTVASWYSMYVQKSKNIREKQSNLEEKASTIFYSPK
jgi:hypothetical protein